MDNKILNGEKNELDNEELNIRPSHLEEYIGQSEVKENIKVFIVSAILFDISDSLLQEIAPIITPPTNKKAKKYTFEFSMIPFKALPL